MGCPPLLSSAKLSGCQVTEWVVIGIDDTLLAKQLLPEFLRHGPLERQELQLHGTIVLHVALSGPQTTAGISNRPDLAFLLLGKHRPKAAVTCVYLQNKEA